MLDIDNVDADDEAIDGDNEQKESMLLTIFSTPQREAEEVAEAESEEIGAGDVISYTESMVDIMSRQRDAETERVSLLAFWEHIDYDYHSWCQCCRCYRTQRTLCTADFGISTTAKDCIAWSCKRCGFWLFSFALFILIASFLSVDGDKLATPRPRTSTDSVGYPICEL